MNTSPAAHAHLNMIDIESFFQSLSGKMDMEKIESIAAAMAECVVGDRTNRILKCSGVDPSRMLIKRKQLKDLSRRS